VAGGRGERLAGGRRAALKPTAPRQLQTLKAEFFRALAHSVRIRLLEVLASSGAQNVQALQQKLSIGQPIVSQQLGWLRTRGIVTAHKAATTVTYALADPMIADLLRAAKRDSEPAIASRLLS
jgi:ArsR family transcriptional regulator